MKEWAKLSCSILGRGLPCPNSSRHHCEEIGKMRENKARKKAVSKPLDASEEIVFVGRTASQLWEDAENLRKAAVQKWGLDEVSALKSASAFLFSSGLLHRPR